MKVIRNVAVTLASAGWFALVSTTAHAQFAGDILSYLPGTGFAAGYTNASSALGSPALGGGVTPFSPPFSANQLVSIGAGGEITLQMNTPIVNDPAAPFGLNFIIFANSFFVQNGGTGQNATTSGSLFFHSASTLVQVSPDDINWYTLNPAVAPQPGEFFPTYGGGNPLFPVNPALANMNFAGMTLAQIESLYGGSAGGTGYSLAWAQDSNGNSVDLATADYVRIEVQSGVLDMDAISAVPEPGAWALILVGGAVIWFWSNRAGLRGLLQKTVCKLPLIMLGSSLCWTSFANSISEDFSTDPLQNGWSIFGDTNLFQWNSTNQNLDVTWDSSQSNSYFYLPLGTTLGKPDAFTIDFDITLNDVQWTNVFQLAVGLLNFTNATDPGFSRPNGTSPNVFEFDYFPDSGDSLNDPNVEAAMTDATTNITDYPDFYFVYDDLPMQTGVTYHVTLNHAAGDGAITGMMLTNGQIYTTMPIVGDTFGEVIGDFALDTVAIMSYSGAGQDPTYFGSILAHGTVDNIVVTLPPTVRNFAGTFTNGVWQVQFGTYTGWNYTLERSTNLISWTDASPPTPGTGNMITFSDTNALSGQAFYRMRAEQP